MYKLNRVCFFIISFTSISFLIFSIYSIIFFNELNTMISLRKIDDINLYTADIDGHYYIENFDECGGASNIDDLTKFLSVNITRGLPSLIDLNITFNIPKTTSQIIDDTLINNYYEENDILLIKTTPTISKYGYKKRYSSISTTSLSFFNIDKDEKFYFNRNIITTAAPYFPLDGINETGLSASVILTSSNYNIDVYDTSKIDVTDTVMLRMILDKAADIYEAKEIIESYDIFPSKNNNIEFIIKDNDNNILEYKFLSKNHGEYEINVSYQYTIDNLLFSQNKINTIVYDNKNTNIKFYHYGNNPKYYSLNIK